MLKLSVGWQDLERERFSSIVESYQDKIEEVYFPWHDCATGRSMIGDYCKKALQDSLVPEFGG